SAIPPSFDPKVMDQVKELSGVSQTATLYADAVRINNDRTGLAAIDNVQALATMFGVKPSSGTISSLSSGQLILDQPQADSLHLKVGDTVSVQMARGDQQTFTLSGIYAKNDIISGWICSSADASGFTTAQAAQGFITLTPGTNVDSVKAKVNDLL